MPRKRKYPDGLPEWLVRDDSRPIDGAVVYRGRGVELIAVTDEAAFGKRDHGLFVVSGGVRNDHADVHGDTDDWDHALEIIGMNEEVPLGPRTSGWGETWN